MEFDKNIMKAINQVLGNMLGRQPNYRYIEDSNMNRFIWTTEPIIRDRKKRFSSGMYRYYKTRKQWKLCKEVYHAKRFKAKERAFKLRNKFGR